MLPSKFRPQSQPISTTSSARYSQFRMNSCRDMPAISISINVVWWSCACVRWCCRIRSPFSGFKCNFAEFQGCNNYSILMHWLIEWRRWAVLPSKFSPYYCQNLLTPLLNIRNFGAFEWIVLIYLCPQIAISAALLSSAVTNVAWGGYAMCMLTSHHITFLVVWDVTLQFIEILLYRYNQKWA